MTANIAEQLHHSVNNLRKGIGLMIFGLIIAPPVADYVTFGRLTGASVPSLIVTALITTGLIFTKVKRRSK